MVCYLIQVKPAQILTLMEYQRSPFSRERNRKEMDTAGMLRIDPVVKIRYPYPVAIQALLLTRVVMPARAFRPFQ
jgi:hypothetical protein